MTGPPGATVCELHFGQFRWSASEERAWSAITPLTKLSPRDDHRDLRKRHPADLAPKSAMLFLEELEDLRLLLVQPAREHRDDAGDRRPDSVHRGRTPSPNRSVVNYFCVGGVSAPYGPR